MFLMFQLMALLTKSDITGRSIKLMIYLKPTTKEMVLVVPNLKENKTILIANVH